MDDSTSQPPLLAVAAVEVATRRLLSALPAQRRLAEIARTRRTTRVRRVQLEAESSDATLTFSELRRESTRLVEQHRRPIRLHARHPKARAWRKAEIDFQIELLVQGLEDRIAMLPTGTDAAPTAGGLASSPSGGADRAWHRRVCDALVNLDEQRGR